MQPKKNSKADLESKKFIFWEIGMIITLALIYSAFEWKIDTSVTEGFQTIEDAEVFEEEIIPVTRMFMKPPPPPPKVVTNVLDIVDDEDIIDDDLVIEDAEAEEESESKIVELYEEGEEYGEYDDEYVFAVVEEMPYFPGGYKALMKWLSSHLQYPQIARMNNIQGKVFVNFVVNQDGTVCNVKVTRSVDGSLDNEAVRVVESMPKWKPGKQRGKSVRCSFTLPVSFTLR